MNTNRQKYRDMNFDLYVDVTILSSILSKSRHTSIMIILILMVLFSPYNIHILIFGRDWIQYILYSR